METSLFAGRFLFLSTPHYNVGAFGPKARGNAFETAVFALRGKGDSAHIPI